MWLSLEDKNTGFFHASTKGRRAINRITVLETSERVSVYEDEQIIGTVEKYFRDIFTSTRSSAIEVVNKAIKTCITAETNERLIEIMSPLEVKEALFLVHPDKAPGPDGFSASFFQSNWETVGPAITREIQNFFYLELFQTQSTLLTSG